MHQSSDVNDHKKRPRKAAFSIWFAILKIKLPEEGQRILVVGFDVAYGDQRVKFGLEIVRQKTRIRCWYPGWR
jgi:hypothetical protein